MSIDLSAIFGGAQAANAQGMTDVLKQGGNAALGYLEQQAIGVIQQDQAQKSAQVQDFIKQQLSTPANPNSFGSYLSNLAGQPVLSQYGIYILGGIALVVAMTLMVRK